MSHVIFNAHLVRKAGPVISGNFHHVCDFTWRCSYHTEPLFTDKLRKSRLIMNVVLHNFSMNIPVPWILLWKSDFYFWVTLLEISFLQA